MLCLVDLVLSTVDYALGPLGAAACALIEAPLPSLRIDRRALVLGLMGSSRRLTKEANARAVPSCCPAWAAVLSAQGLSRLVGRQPSACRRSLRLPRALCCLYGGQSFEPRPLRLPLLRHERLRLLLRERLVLR
mmetsp:Transcript_9551/g.21290  ORF Transcript_9551/g.21290 Transcript_9551/m.21290 type:complete len:134 (+) Transcript_9551:71-472(+)